MARTTATLVRTARASQVRVTGGICVNQASKPTGIDAVGEGDDAGLCLAGYNTYHHAHAEFPNIE